MAEVPHAAEEGASATGATEVDLHWVDGARLDALAVDDLLVFLLAGEVPLGGVAGLVDWRLCGQLSRAVAAGQHRCQVGERVLWPAPRPMRCARILVCGLGAAATLDAETMAAEARAATSAARGAGGPSNPSGPTLHRSAAALPALGPQASKRDQLAVQMLFVRAMAPLLGHGVAQLLRG